MANNTTNIVASTLIPKDILVNLYLRRNDKKKKGPDQFFWGGIDAITGENIPNLMESIISTKKQTKNRKGVHSNIANSLQTLFDQTKDREEKFLEALRNSKQINIMPKFITPKKEDDLNMWKNYVTNFHNYVIKLLDIPENVRNLITTLRSKEFVAIVGGQISALSSTKIKKSDQSYEDFFFEMGKLLLDKNKNKKSFTARQYTQEDIGDILKFIEDYNFQDSFKNGIQEQTSKIYQSAEAIDTLVSSINETIKKEFPSMVYWRTSTREKGISANFEQRLKKTTLEIFRQFFPDDQNKMMELTPKDQQNPYNITLLLRPKLNEQAGTYSMDVSTKINELSKQDDTTNIKNKIYEIFYNYVYKSLNTKELKDTWENNKATIKSAIFQDIDKKGKGKKFRSATSISSILEGYGESGVKGVFGEIAAALQFSYMGETSVTGSDVTKAGQLSFDVVIKTLNGQFGVQVKNFNNFRLNDFYKTEFKASNENEMDKYFGDDKQKYWFLLANGCLIQEAGIMRQDALNRRMEQSFYNHVDSFLRITALDITQELKNDTGIDINSSDIFIIGSYIVPASFLLYLVYRRLSDEDIKNKDFFELEVPGSIIQPLILQETGRKGIRISNIDKNIFDGYKIKFNGLNADITLKGINF